MHSDGRMAEESNTISKINQIQSLMPIQDVDRLRDVMRKMLNRLEAALDEMEVFDEAKIKQRSGQYDRLFGSKTSLAETLVMIAELLMKVEVFQGAREEGQGQQAMAIALPDADVALVEAFVQRMQQMDVG